MWNNSSLMNCKNAGVDSRSVNEDVPSTLPWYNQYQLFVERMFCVGAQHVAGSHVMPIGIRLPSTAWWAPPLPFLSLRPVWVFCQNSARGPRIQSSCRHLTSTCRSDNDYLALVARDHTERNLISVGFAEFHGDGEHGVEYVDVEVSKAQLVWIADYERQL